MHIIINLIIIIIFIIIIFIVIFITYDFDGDKVFEAAMRYIIKNRSHLMRYRFTEGDITANINMIMRRSQTQIEALHGVTMDITTDDIDIDVDYEPPVCNTA